MKRVMKMKELTKALFKDVCIILAVAAFVVMMTALINMISGESSEVHALEYRVTLKSVKPSGGGFKVTWAKPGIAVSGFRIRVAYPGGRKYYFAGKDATSKTIKKLGKRYFNMFKDYTFHVEAYKTSSGKKDYGDPSNGMSPQVEFSIPATEKASPYWSESIIENSTKFVYNGKVHKPSAKVKFIRDTTEYPEVKTKVSSKHYTRKFPSGCKAIGRYKMKVVLKNGYRGSKSKYFYIVPKATSITSLSGSKSGSDGIINVKWKKQASRTSGYQVFYSYDLYEGDDEADSVNYQEKVKLVKGNTKTSVKLTGLERHKTYQVAVRTYKTVKGKKIYSKWSAPKTVLVP